MDDDRSQQKLVPAVERATDILDIVAASKRFLTVSELSRQTGLPKSTAHNLCATLVQLGLLIRRPDQTYILGPHVLRWSNAFDRQTDIAAEFASLWDQTEILPEALVSLAVAEKSEVVFIAARQTTGGHRFSIRPGLRLPAAYVAAGKAILSCWPDHEIRRTFADGLPDATTPDAVRDLPALLDEIRAIRSQGYAIEHEQHQPGITSLGAPVLNSLNRPLASVMISVASELFAGAARDELCRIIVEIAASLSRRMGAGTTETG